ncbi:MAG: hypothetical protein R3250_10425, partial [Melioribacteraceae bacterium]|nr:hypothetical protein [Melioribacteraceae bacterium]
MSVLVYTESDNGKFKKVAFEVASFAKGIADQLGTTTTAVAINANESSELGKYGVNKVLNVSNPNLNAFKASTFAEVIKQAVDNEGSSIIVLSSSINSKYLSSILAVKLNAGLASNVISLPLSTSPFLVKRAAFTNKAIEHCQINTDIKIVA